ncbi:MAG: xanthine dehydrogenase family protein molybdopterin-binding subunit [Candidatus Rariloculaceae bacterium]
MDGQITNQAIGQPLRRREDRRLITGQGRFSDDYNLPNQCYAQFLRSPYAHAVIEQIDVSQALSSPGVIAVLTGEDWRSDGHGNIPHVADPADGCDPSFKTFAGRGGFVFDDGQPVIATDKVRHVGEPVAVVVAETVEAAKDALELVVVDYRELPAQATIEDAMASADEPVWTDALGNVCLDTHLWDEESEVDAAFASAAHVIEREFSTNRVVGGQTEPRSGIGNFDADSEQYFLYAGSQGSIRLRNGMARVFGVSPDKIRVVSEDVGGGFGPRNFLYPDFALLPWAARHIGRPVKWTSTRSETFQSDTQGRDNILKLSFAFDAQHRFLGIKLDFLANIGAAPVSYAPIQNVARLATSTYDVPLVHTRVRGILTNTVPTGPYRGAGRPELIYAIERLLDIYSREQEIDRIELRRKNLIPPESIPYEGRTAVTIDSGEFEKTMDLAMRKADWNGFEQRRKASAAEGRLRGIGLASFMEIPVGFPHESAILTARGDGIVELEVGTQCMGMGHATAFAQVLSDLLAIPVESVELVTGDTDRIAMGGGAHSDRSMRLVGTLLVQAAEELIARAKPLAADKLGVAEAGVEYTQGQFRSADADQTCSLFELVASSDGIAEDDRGRKTLSVDVELHDRLPAYPNGCACSEIEIDPETGTLKLLRHTLVHDAGVEINPMILEGQSHGGIAQGIGQAMLENFVYSTDDAQILSGSFMDYCLPRADDLPNFSVGSNPTAAASNPLGIKGGGESGTTAALGAFFNAVSDALASLGIEEVPMPATSAKLWELIRQAQAERDSDSDDAATWSQAATS